MADYYWVGGGANTNWDTLANWEVGGSTPAAAPTSTDNVIFDANSDPGGIFTVTVNVTANCANFTASGLDFTMTLAGTAALNVYGNLSIPASNFTWSHTGTLSFLASSGTQTVTTNGTSLSCPITINGASVTVQITGNLTTGSTRTTTLTAGTLDLQTYTWTTGLFSTSNSNTRNITFGSGAKIIVTGTSGTLWGGATLTNLTFTGTNRVDFTGTGGTGTVQHGNTAGISVPKVLNWYVSGSNALTISSTSYFGVTDFTGFTGSITASVMEFYGDVTFASGMTLGSGVNSLTFTTGNLTSNGKTIDQPVTIAATTGSVTLIDNLTLGSTRNLTLTSGTLVIPASGVVTAQGFASGSTSARAVTFGSNSYISLGGTGTITVVNFGNATNFSYTGTSDIRLTANPVAGTTRTISFATTAPTEARALTFKVTAGSDTISMNGIAKNLDFTGFTGTLANTAFTVYGNLTLVSGMTLTAGTNALTFAATSGTQTFTSGTLTVDFPVTVNAPSATVSLADNLTLGSTRALTLTAGTFSVNGKTASIGSFASAGTTSRTVGFGSAGNITVVGAGATAWSASGSNLTTSGTGTISMTSASAKTFDGGGYTYVATLNQGGAGALTIAGSNTFGSLTNSTQPATITFTATTTTTFTSGFAPAGTSGNLITINSSSAGSNATLAFNSGTISLSYCSLQDSAARGVSALAYYSNGNINVSGNTGWLFTPVTNSSGFMGFFV